MAWRAYLNGAVAKGGGLDLEATILYYDAADPANSGVGPGPPPVSPTVILHSKRFAFPPEYTRQQIQAVIVMEGQRARDSIAEAAAINAQFPDGSTIAIS